VAPRMSKMVVENESQRPWIIWVEPWAEDFTLLPGERLEIISQGDSAQPWFQVVEQEQSTQVYVMGGDYDVLQNGTRLQGGHNRQAAIDAGLYR
jgi:hypothetical protein